MLPSVTFFEETRLFPTGVFKAGNTRPDTPWKGAETACFRRDFIQAPSPLFY
jgi:hypothetical protein